MRSPDDVPRRTAGGAAIGSTITRKRFEISRATRASRRSWSSSWSACQASDCVDYSQVADAAWLDDVLSEVFRDAEGVIYACAFGSVARGCAHRESDIDGVLLEWTIYPIERDRFEVRVWRRPFDPPSSWHWGGE